MLEKSERAHCSGCCQNNVAGHARHHSCLVLRGGAPLPRRDVAALWRSLLEDGDLGVQDADQPPLQRAVPLQQGVQRTQPLLDLLFGEVAVAVRGEHEAGPGTPPVWS